MGGMALNYKVVNAWIYTEASSPKVLSIRLLRCTKKEDRDQSICSWSAFSPMVLSISPARCTKTEHQKQNQKRGSLSEYMLCLRFSCFDPLLAPDPPSIMGGMALNYKVVNAARVNAALILRKMPRIVHWNRSCNDRWENCQHGKTTTWRRTVV